MHSFIVGGEDSPACPLSSPVLRASAFLDPWDFSSFFSSRGRWLTQLVQPRSRLWGPVSDSQILCCVLNSCSLLPHHICGLHDVARGQAMASGQDDGLFQRHTQGAPMHAAVAHDDVAGPEPAAQLRGNGQQSHSRGTAGCVRTGSCALGSDKRSYQSIELIQSIERPH